MRNLLLHPRATLAIVVGACLTIDSICGGIATSIVPLAHTRGLERVAPEILNAVVVLGVISNVALALAGIGRSIVSAIDAPGHD